MGKTDKVSKEELLKLDIEIYNEAMKLIWVEHKKRMNLSGELSTCRHCGRLYSICCICNEAIQQWEDMLKEVREVSSIKTTIPDEADGCEADECGTCNHFNPWANDSDDGYCLNKIVVGSDDIRVRGASIGSMHYIEGKIDPEGTEVEGLKFKRNFGCKFHSNNG